MEGAGPQSIVPGLGRSGEEKTDREVRSLQSLAEGGNQLFSLLTED
jgi:hypothetical protein